MPKKIIDIEESTDGENSENESEGTEIDVLTKPIRKTTTVLKKEKPKKILSEKQKAVLEKARKTRSDNIAKAKQNKKIEAAKLLIEQETNLKLKSTEEAKPIEQKKKSKTKTIIIESDSESSSEEEIIIKKKHNKNKPKKRYVKEESESEEEEESKPKPKARHLKPQINESKLIKHNIFDGFC